MIIDKLDNFEMYVALNPYFAKAFDYLKNTDFSTVKPGKYEIEGENLFAIINEYETKEAANCCLEAHKKYIDIQFLSSGSEKIGVALFVNQIPIKEYDVEDDYHLFNEEVSYISFKKGMFGVFFPDDLHMPGVICNNHPETVKKVVLKVKI